MNLMFWKKKTGAEAEAESMPGNLAVNTKQRESLDFATTKQGDAESHPEQPEPETPAKAGLAARLKLQFAGLTRHFRKAPAFRADKDQASKQPDDSEKPDDAAAVAPDLEAPGMEVPAKQGLIVRVKLWLVALTRRFSKKTAAETAEDQEEEPSGRSKTAQREDSVDETPEIKPARSRKPLFVGAAIGLLILLLIAIGIVIWPYLMPPPTRSITRHDNTDNASHAIQPEPAVNKTQTNFEEQKAAHLPEKPQTGISTPNGGPASEIPPTETGSPKNEPAPKNSQTEIEALKKQNAELQAQIEALKKQPQQQSYVPPARHTGGNAPSSAVSGELMAGNKDPQATAMTLKEAIEAMNASSGERVKKPAK